MFKEDYSQYSWGEEPSDAWIHVILERLERLKLTAKQHLLLSAMSCVGAFVLYVGWTVPDWQGRLVCAIGGGLSSIGLTILCTRLHRYYSLRLELLDAYEADDIATLLRIDRLLQSLVKS